MSIIIDNNPQTQPSAKGISEAHPGGLTGQHQGEKVVQKTNIMSLIANAAEELSFSASERVEKKLSKRKTGKETAGMKKSAMERAETYLKKLPDIGKPEKLQQFLEHLKKKGFQSAQQLISEAKKYFNDISHQYAGLSYVAEILEKEDKKNRLIKSLKKAMDIVTGKHGSEIRTGFNITNTANDFSKQGLGGVQTLRDLYRNTILKYEGFHQTYQSILKHYGPEKFPDAIAYLIKAVGTDFSSKGPSISSAELKLIIDDLYQVEVLGNIHKECSELMEKLKAHFDIDTGISASDIMARIMNLKEERWLKQDAILMIIQETRIKDLEAQIYFLRELKNLIRDIPLKVYEEPETRVKLIDSVQEALDKTIDKEEELE